MDLKNGVAVRYLDYEQIHLPTSWVYNARNTNNKSNMNYPNGFDETELDGLTEAEEEDYLLHEEAGLVWESRDEDGNVWIGTEDKWERYKNLLIESKNIKPF